MKLKSIPDNPTYNCVFEPYYILGFVVKELLLYSRIQFDCIDKSSLSPVPPWLLKPPEFVYAQHDIGTKS